MKNLKKKYENDEVLPPKPGPKPPPPPPQEENE